MNVLTKEKARELLYDVKEMDEFPIIRFGDEISYIDFEKGEYTWFVLQCKTFISNRNQGLMKKLIPLFLEAARKANVFVEWGVFTRDGKKYIKHLIVN